MVQPIGSSTPSYSTATSASGGAPVIRKAELDSAASALGVAYSDIVSALTNGQSIADVARAKGVALSDVETAMAAPAKSTLDRELQSGTITQTEHDQLLQGVQAQVTKAVNWSSGNAGVGATESVAAMEQADALAALIGTTATSAGDASLLQSLVGNAAGFAGAGPGSATVTDPLLISALQQSGQSVLGYSASGQPAGAPSSLMSLIQQLNAQA